ncbi:hypothetical protein [Aquamicrobium sp. LC103]|uniref:hypothetical protein n=1 Tax=Aquamicrobium sp. LC103 TaxID=1120658 RepID=UPI00063EB3B7|nr:hypothetical protein [Aquamicrobium sp. LC103]TKT78408.1 hypothetical protein XW59_012390 [Aquamicrobium sp. LC103]
MNFHLGTINNGQMRFAVGSFSRGAGYERMLFRTWKEHRIAALYGISFGHKCFIGVIRLHECRERHERIK